MKAVSAYETADKYIHSIIGLVMNERAKMYIKYYLMSVGTIGL